MIFIEATDENLDRRVHRFCAPLFASDRTMQQGHNETVTNATVTFFKFQSRIYAVTCHHVIAAFHAETMRTGLPLAPAVHSGHTIWSFGNYEPSGKFRWSFVSCREFPTSQMLNEPEALDTLDGLNSNRPDIAIADITEIWPLFVKHRQAEAIDLDSWVSCGWSNFHDVWLAFGFPDGHKELVGNMVNIPMPRVKATISRLPEDSPTFWLSATLKDDHGWGFSGLSGGPILAAHKTEERYAFVGITFEGQPGIKGVSHAPGSIFGGSDIVLCGYVLNPECFQDWLSSRKYFVEVD
jgi:hypothetical protein